MRTAVSLLVVGGVLPLTACEVKDRAVDCAKLAISVSRAYDEMERTALTAALDQDAAQFTDAMAADAEKVKDRTDNVEIRSAADAVLAAAENVREAAVEGVAPDLSPLGDATSELTRVCTPAG